MPVIASARLKRGNGVYLAGEKLECEIDLECTGDEETVVAWLSAQVHCQEVARGFKGGSHQPKKVERLAQEDIAASGATSFVPNIGEHGNTIYSSRPEVLCCSLTLQPGEDKKFCYRHTLPNGQNVPPTFRGSAVKYLYKVTVGVQTTRSAVKLLRVPFRMLAFAGSSDLSSLDKEGGRPRSPPPSPLELADLAVESVTSQRAPRTFRVADERGAVCCIEMPKKCFKLGEDVLGVVSFEDTDSDNICTEFSAYLQTVEEIIGDDSARPGTDQQQQNDRAKNTHAVTHCEQHEFCACYASCQLRLQAPTAAAPSFFTDFVNVKWRLRFEFSVSSREALPPAERLPNDGGVVRRIPDSARIRRLLWDTPVKMYPCNPAYVQGDNPLVRVEVA